MMFDSMETNLDYDVMRDGTVVAVRIYEGKGGMPYAELILAFGGRRTICWVDVNHRNTYAPGITGYTYFYDERQKCLFSKWK